MQGSLSGIRDLGREDDDEEKKVMNRTSITVCVETRVQIHPERAGKVCVDDPGLGERQITGG